MGSDMIKNNLYCTLCIGVGTMGAGSGGWCPPMFSDTYIARLNFLHTDRTALAYRSIEPPFTKLSSYASVVGCHTSGIKRDCLSWSIVVNPAGHWWCWELLWCCDEQPRHYNSYSVLHCNTDSSGIGSFNCGACHIITLSSAIYLNDVSSDVFTLPC